MEEKEFEEATQVKKELQDCKDKIYKVKQLMTSSCSLYCEVSGTLKDRFNSKQSLQIFDKDGIKKLLGVELDTLQQREKALTEKFKSI